MISTSRRWVDRVFHLEELNGGAMCPTYMKRWTLLRALGCALYLHKFVDDDWTTDLHDHPKRFVSLGLWGRYRETRDDGTTQDYRAPWLRSFPAEHRHRITLFPDRRPCWTLVLVLRTVRAWGFWPGGRWVWWKEYVGSDAARAAKVCGDDDDYDYAQDDLNFDAARERGRL